MKHIKTIGEYLNEAVRVETNRYERSHGKKPRGYGRWAFYFDDKGGEPIFTPKAMSYTDAVKWAKEEAKKAGKEYVYVGESVNEEYTYNEFVKDNLGKKYVENEEKSIKLALKLLGVKSGDDIKELTNTMDSANTALYLDNAKENGELTKLPIKSKYFEKAYLGKWKNGEPMLAFSDGYDYFVYIKK